MFKAIRVRACESFSVGVDPISHKVSILFYSMKAAFSSSGVCVYMCVCVGGGGAFTFVDPAIFACISLPLR